MDLGLETSEQIALELPTLDFKTKQCASALSNVYSTGNHLVNFELIHLSSEEKYQNKKKMLCSEPSELLPHSYRAMFINL